MNKQAEEVLAQMMERALNGMDAATDFASQEIPIVVEQLLVWEMVSSATLALVLLSFSCVYVYSWIMSYSICTNTKNDTLLFVYVEALGSGRVVTNGDSMFLYLYSLLGGFLAAIALFAGATNVLTFLKVVIAPKLFLLEYAAALVK